MRRRLIAATAAALLALTACTDSRTAEERERQNANYEQLNADQPASAMDL